MKINNTRPQVKTYDIHHFDFGDVGMDGITGKFYLVVKSENDKKQLINLTDNLIIREGRSLSLMPCTVEVNVKSIG